MTTYKELLILHTEAEYKSIYEEEYCKQDIFTHDGVLVKFYPERFEHAFFKSSSRRKADKSIFSFERAQRIRWIRDVLLDPTVPVFSGYDKNRKKYDSNRRVSLVTPDNYVVVIRLSSRNPNEAAFITAFICDDEEVVKKIKSSPLGSLADIHLTSDV